MHRSTKNEMETRQSKADIFATIMTMGANTIERCRQMIDVAETLDGYDGTQTPEERAEVEGLLYRRFKCGKDAEREVVWMMTNATKDRQIDHYLNYLRHLENDSDDDDDDENEEQEEEEATPDEVSIVRVVSPRVTIKRLADVTRDEASTYGIIVSDDENENVREVKKVKVEAYKDELVDEQDAIQEDKKTDKKDNKMAAASSSSSSFYTFNTLTSQMDNLKGANYMMSYVQLDRLVPTDAYATDAVFLRVAYAGPSEKVCAIAGPVYVVEAVEPPVRRRRVLVVTYADFVNLPTVKRCLRKAFRAGQEWRQKDDRSLTPYFLVGDVSRVSGGFGTGSTLNLYDAAQRLYGRKKREDLTMDEVAALVACLRDCSPSSSSSSSSSSV